MVDIKDIPIEALQENKVEIPDEIPLMGTPQYVIYPFMMEWRGSSETVPGAGPDPITISPDRRTVTVSFTTTLAADEARILVAIPEPACAMVLLLGFSAATFRRGRQ